MFHIYICHKKNKFKRIYVNYNTNLVISQQKKFSIGHRKEPKIQEKKQNWNNPHKQCFCILTFSTVFRQIVPVYFFLEHMIFYDVERIFSKKRILFKITKREQRLLAANT